MSVLLLLLFLLLMFLLLLSVVLLRRAVAVWRLVAAVAAAVAAELRLELRVGRALFATLAELAFRNMRKTCAATQTVVEC